MPPDPWDGPADRPGSEETLLALHGLVPAAEEQDLADEAAAERVWRMLVAGMRAEDRRGGYADELFDDLGEPDRPAVERPAEEPSDGEGLTTNQTLGMLEHLLGAEPVEDGDD